MPWPTTRRSSQQMNSVNQAGQCTGSSTLEPPLSIRSIQVETHFSAVISRFPSWWNHMEEWIAADTHVYKFSHAVGVLHLFCFISSLPCQERVSEQWLRCDFSSFMCTLSLLELCNRCAKTPCIVFSVPFSLLSIFMLYETPKSTNTF